MDQTQYVNLFRFLMALKDYCMDHDLLPAVVVLYPADGAATGQHALGVGTADTVLIEAGLRDGLKPDTVYGGIT